MNRLNIEITDRVKFLREEVVHAKPILCSERAKIVTKVYKETENQHETMRRALVFKAVLEGMTQNIWEEELIVGSHGSNGRRSAPVFPEFAVAWLEEELEHHLEEREQDTFVVPLSVKKELYDLFPYWRDKTIYKRYRARLPKETKHARDAYMFTRDLFERGGYGHTAYNAKKVLNNGFIKIKEEILSYMNALDLTSAEGLEKQMFYKAELICIDAVITYAKRYGDKAKILSEKFTGRRKDELLKIADVCHWILENPARDIYDAIQTIAFLQIIIQTETSGDSVSPGRVDQYLYPYYQEAIQNGSYSDEEIQELLDCLWLKFNEIVKVQDSESIHIHPGFPMTPNLTIGGITPLGDDAVNELSFMMLNSQEHIKLTNPQFTVRIHPKTSCEFKSRVAEIVALGTGMPAMFGDCGCMEAIQNTFPDMPIECVRDYGIVGCVELAPAGFQGKVNGGFLNVARVVDLAVNQGIDRLTQRPIGPETPIPQSYEAFLKNVEIQARYFIKHQVINAAVVDMTQRVYMPHLFLSSMIDGCLESGKDMTYGASLWGATPILHVGMATATNSVTAIKKHVFDDKSLSMNTLNQALNSDFKGEYQQIRELLMTTPKYGNDDDYADETAKTVTSIFFDIIESFQDVDGKPYTSMILTLGATVPHGWATGATADGRHAGMPVSDSLSPSNLGESIGPTGVVLSASKLDQKRMMQGNVLNLKFNKKALTSEASRQKLMNLVGVYFNELKGQEVQVNVVDGEMLRDAQIHPEHYRDLIIRIAGYSARFVELAKELQDDIIAREEHQVI